MNKTYIALPFNNQNLNIETIYFTDLFLGMNVKNPATQALFTDAEKAALAQADLTAPENGCVAISSYDPKAVLWFDETGAKAIVSHADPLSVKNNTIINADGEIIATALIC